MKPIKYLRLQDWQEVNAGGIYDPGRRPVAPFVVSSGDPVIEPEHPVGNAVGGLYGSEFAKRRRQGQRARDVRAKLDELGIRPKR